MSLQSVQIKRLEEHWISLPCAFESFVPADELLLNFQVAAFNLSNKKKEMLNMGQQMKMCKSLGCLYIKRSFLLHSKFEV